MKKNWWKRALSIGLVFGMTAGLCACGGGKGQDASLAKVGVYKMQEFDMPEIDGDDYNIIATTHKNGKIYLMMQVHHWTEEGSSEDIRLLTMEDDGTEIKMTTLEIPEWDYQTPGAGSVDMPVMPRTETEGDGNGEADSEEDTGSDDAADPEEDNGSDDAADSEENTGSDDENDPEGDTGSGDGESPEDEREPNAPDSDGEIPEGEEVWENSSYENYNIGADGNIYAIRRYYYENYSTETYTQKDYITSWGMDGKLLRETELEGIRSEEEWSYINTMTVAQDGTVTLILSGDTPCKMTVDAQGNVSEKVPFSEEVGKIFSNIDRIIQKEDGTFLIVYYDENDYSKEFLATFDPATDKMGEPQPMPGNFSYAGYNVMGTGTDFDLLCCNNSGVYTYKAGDEDCVQKMSFINSDLNISSFNSLVAVDENTFVGVFYEDYNNGLKAGRFTYVDPKDIPDKTVLVLAGSYIDGNMKKRVIEYNRNSDEYRIVVRSYDSLNSYDDWQAGYGQLNNDIITGNMPDILITTGLPVENYVAKGLLEDVGSLIEKDEELSQTEFLQNIFDAFSVDGKLYYVIPNFNVSTLMGKSAIVGDRTSWTMAEMLELQNSLPEGTNMIGEMTRSGFFQTAMRFCGSDFVDVSTGKCDFDSQNFISMMEYAKTLPEELSEDYFGEDYWANYESQYRDGRTILSSLSISNIRDINYSVNGYFGEDVSYIGFPTENGKGSYAMANECYAISSRSKNTEAAWEFLRYYLTEEYQSSLQWGLPVQKKYFDENAKNALGRPFYIDEEGTKQEYDENFYLNGEAIVLDPLTQEQVDKVVSFILSIDKCYYYNEDIINIVNEEMDAFFTGQKSAQEVAKIIQNRAQIYVNENR